MTTGIIFDLDGVLLDYSYRFHKTYQDILTPLGIICPSREELYTLRRTGKTTEEILDTLLPQDLQGRKEKIAYCKEKRKDIIETQEYLTYDQFFPEAIPLLKKLKEQGYITGIITKRKNKEQTEKQLQPIQHLLTFIIVTQTKKEAIQQALKKYSIDTCYFITDTSEDIHEGKKAGVKTIGITTGIENEELLAQAQPDYLVKDLTTLQQLLKQLS
ncbi:MAG: HAD family hydrolase [Nanoarchaeota archaeon]|nr:HAD family hydrolase [Nanoarchaeota archaeon]